jgi:hypothetical protein
MGRKSKTADSPQKQRLSLAELADHDDVCSDVMIDNVCSTLSPNTKLAFLTP